jgi:hypothetical protein
VSRPVRSLASLLAFVVVVATAGAAHPAAASSSSGDLWKPLVEASIDPMVDLDEYEDRLLVAINR